MASIQIHTINSDGRCQDIFTLLEKDRARDSTTPRQQIAYRMEVEQVLNQDENLYRLEWVRSRVGLWRKSRPVARLADNPPLSSRSRAPTR